MDAMEMLRKDLLDNWLRARDGVTGQVEMLEDEQLGWAPGKGARTGLQIARHIAGASTALLAYATAGAPPSFAEPTDEVGREQVLEDLRRGRDEIEASVRSISAEDLTATLPGLFGGESTRFVFLTFCYAHEMYHFGQLGMCARAGGAVPALTQYIEAQRRQASA